MASKRLFLFQRTVVREETLDRLIDLSIPCTLLAQAIVELKKLLASKELAQIVTRKILQLEILS